MRKRLFSDSLHHNLWHRLVLWKWASDIEKNAYENNTDATPHILQLQGRICHRAPFYILLPQYCAPCCRVRIAADRNMLDELYLCGSRTADTPGFMVQSSKHEGHQPPPPAPASDSAPLSRTMSVTAFCEMCMSNSIIFPMYLLYPLDYWLLLKLYTSTTISK